MSFVTIFLLSFMGHKNGYKNTPGFKRRGSRPLPDGRSVKAVLSRELRVREVRVATLEEVPTQCQPVLFLFLDYFFKIVFIYLRKIEREREREREREQRERQREKQALR